MTDTLARPRSPIAVAAAALSLLVALAALLSGLGSRWGLWNFGMGFKILGWSARCGIAVAVLSLVAVLLTRPGGSRRGFSFALLGLVVSLVVAIVQFWPDWTMILIVLAVFGAGQFVEGNILSPKLVGDSVGLHPVWLMFALVAFGSLFGFVGLLLAVPLAAAVGVLVRFALKQYLASPLYDPALAPPRDSGRTPLP